MRIVANLLRRVNRVKHICNGKIMSEFSERLKELRGTESQASFAAAIGMNRVQYAKYESGTNSPSVDALSKICRVHACSADWLLGLREASTKHPSTSEAQAPKHQPPGSLPACSKCPYKKKWQKVESMK